MTLKQKAIKFLEKREHEKILDLEKDFARWNWIFEHGSNDPSWPDGTNLNLVRTHIITEQKEIMAVVVNPPSVAYRPIPPEVPDGYMVVGGDYFDVRNKRMQRFGNLVYSAENEQISLF